jgi:hypothetical protein
MKKMNNDKGFAIMTVLFFLVIVTILAVAAITLQAVQLRVAGTSARLEMSRVAENGGVNLLIPLVQEIYYNGKTPVSYSTKYVNVTAPTLDLELTDPQYLQYKDSVHDATPNIGSISIGNTSMIADVDSLGAGFMAGGSTEASQGYYKPAATINGFKIVISNANNQADQTCQVIWLKSII